VTPLIADIADPEAVSHVVTEVETAHPDRRLSGLVNNAGIAVGGPFAFQPFEEFEQHITINAVGTMRLTRGLLPVLGVDRQRTGRSGRIVNISSVGGRLGPPFLSAYAASKHAIEGWSKSLRVELVPYGIDVIVIGPGGVATPIWDKAERQDPSLYMDTPYRDAALKMQAQMIRDGRKGLSPDGVASVVVEALTLPRPKLRYAPVPKRFLNWTIPSLMPDRVFMSVVSRMVGLKRPDAN
jgi:NAD(P)-dependent dehydrogenase (short-subunit alcohol dehydrogenase family)